MITVRYHIASLCAVILTLGIGIWIGLILNSASLEKNLIRSSRVKLAEVEQERHDIAALLDQNQQALSALVSHTTSGMLYGKRVAIIRMGDYADAAQNATDALEQTGASVVSSTTISDEFDDVSDKTRNSILGPLALAEPWAAVNKDNSSLCYTVVQAIKTGTTNRQSVQDAIDRMSSSGIISYSGNFVQPVDLVIVVGGSSDQPGGMDETNEQSREKMLIDQLISESGFNVSQVVGCEPAQATTSSVPLYQEEGIGSVDCIDEPIGALDMIYDLHGESNSYGIKPGERVLIPESLSDGK